jgi:CheY-like chemotaxis protein
MDIVVTRITGRESTQDGGCRLHVLADLGDTVRANCTIVFPPHEAAALGDTPEASRWLPDRHDAARRRALIVDDEPMLAEILSEHLAERGYATQTASDGGEAIRIAADNPPDVVLLDIMMPGVDGVTVLKRILALDRSLPVVMVTGNGDEELARRTLQLGAFDYVTKPISFERLDEVLSTAVAVRAQDVLVSAAS